MCEISADAPVAQSYGKFRAQPPESIQNGLAIDIDSSLMLPLCLILHQRQCVAWLLTRRPGGNAVKPMVSALVDSQIDLSPNHACVVLGEAAALGWVGAFDGKPWRHLQVYRGRIVENKR